MSIWQKLAQYASFETDRLVLRPFRYDDGEDFYTIVSNPANLTFLFPQKVSRPEADELLTLAFLKSPLGKWALEDKASGRMIGAIQFEKINEHARQAEVGYFLAKDYWNQGLMTEVLECLTDLASDRLGLRELRLVTHLENRASQRVAQKAGFRQGARYKGSDRYTHQTRNYLSWVWTGAGKGRKEERDDHD